MSTYFYVITMDEKTVEKVKSNLNEIKDYAAKFTQNAGWRWVVESVDKTLALMDPEEEMVNEGFDMPTQAQASDGAQSAHMTDVKPEPEITEKTEAELISNSVDEEE